DYYCESWDSSGTLGFF
nr:immunoglobulin light chain junction region [Macaca mulatta]